jgi:hypothetical protein
VLLGSALLVTLVVAPLIERGILRYMYVKDETAVLYKPFWGPNPKKLYVKQ